MWGIAALFLLRFKRDRVKRAEAVHAFKEATAFEWSESGTLEVMKRFPKSPTPAFIYAQHAHRRRDWAEALQRYQILIARAPKDERGYQGAAISLHELKRFEEADALLRRALRRRPSSKILRLEYARNAHFRGEWSEAVERWAAYRASNPTDKRGYEGGAEALRMVGKVAEADALIGSWAVHAHVPSEPAQPG
jgi:predicted Zn-dependent protease